MGTPALRSFLRRHVCYGLCFVVLAQADVADSADPRTFDSLSREYSSGTAGILRQYCVECHSTEAKQGELDLQRFGSFADVRRDPEPWQRVEQMLRDGEMPPEESPQPSPEQKQQLRTWVREYLNAEALASAGDPGPIVLRRLNNSEYRYTIQDVTGVDLHPTRDFPVDGAAGEGFTNVGSAMAMSPSMVTKYLDAAREIAAHAVLLPDGIRFSAKATRRDWTNDLVEEIRDLYRRHTTGNADVNALNRWSIPDPRQSTEQDGRVEPAPYFAAIIEHRDELARDPAAADAIARQTGLNAKYLRLLAERLVAAKPDSLLLKWVSDRLRTANVAEARQLAAEIRSRQDKLWRFQSVGHFGMVRPWQVPENPLPESAGFRVPLNDATADQISVTLVAEPAGDSAKETLVIWSRPRIEFKDRPPILLRDLEQTWRRARQVYKTENARITEYLNAVRELHGTQRPLADVAAERSLNAELLDRWTKLSGLGLRVDRTVKGHLTNRVPNVAGIADVNGWDSNGLPTLLANRGETVANFVTITMPPRSVTLHPTPDRAAIVVWKCPASGSFRISSLLQDADDKCGNGGSWKVTLLNETGISTLAEGTIDNGRGGSFQLEQPVDIQAGDLVSFVLEARNRDHSCDTTAVDMTLAEVGGESRVWNLTREIVDDVLASNPRSDSFGNEAVWHFIGGGENAPPISPIPAGSLLAQWRQAVLDRQDEPAIKILSESLARIVTGNEEPEGEPNRELRRVLTRWDGPLDWRSFGSGLPVEPPAADEPVFKGLHFGRTPNGRPIDPQSLAATAPSSIALRLPAELVAGGEFVVEGTLPPEADQAIVQFQATRGEAPRESIGLQADLPLVTRPEGPARGRLVGAFDEFRVLFPAAMCHARIVPVDEVVTLVLFHREDDHLSRLMLNAEDQRRLDRLWEELRYVSQDALTIMTGYEQLMEFATQDADPRVFEPLREPIRQNGARFQETLLATEPAHVAAVLQLAERVWRRPLSESERNSLNALYRTLRNQSLPHDEAVRLLIVRVFSSPAFLYRIEQPGPGADPGNVSDLELAVRLSYFVWSSLPDARLRKLAAEGRLHQTETLQAELHRMVQDDRVRRLAIEFGCQWLLLRDFDQHNEKSEQQFPEFAGIRDELYEESVLFFTDLFRENRSILDLIDGPRTFVNPELAKFYGIPLDGTGWQPIENAWEHHRGGVLAMGSVLASQSGASRTSPILRGNWVSETLLGERLPRPPKGVPTLPETPPANLTERQLIELHSSEASCAKCHARIDPFGFALENFDGIGRYRQQDQKGHPIDPQAVLLDGTPLAGLDGLREYLGKTRRDDFVRQFCRKLLGYALGRGVRLSDEPLLNEMAEKLRQEDYRVLVAVETIVLSPQFRMIRGRDNAEQGHEPE